MFLRSLIVLMSLLWAACAGCGHGESGPKKVEPCGNGIIDFAETCDIAIEGSCATECPTTDPCNPLELVGSPGSCSSDCVPTPSTCGTDDDQCCPAGCGIGEDSDCDAAALCGDGVLDAAETCDPAIPSGRSGACECPPTGVSCEEAVLQGSPTRCDIQCTSRPVAACDSGDGCCPDGCAIQGDSDCMAICGNDITEGAELCDGNCPTFCDDGDDCTIDALTGTSAACDAQCETNLVTACVDSDGCCAPGCTPSNDNDCVAVCGNDLIEVGETCDGNCPVACDDGNACTTDALVGSAANCDADCSTAAIVACTSGDGCCPTGCTDVTDSDCVAVCGNGIVEPPESCDGNCPAVCSDGDACTTDVRGGSNLACDVSCTFVPMTACVDNDGCCPTGCNAANDNDCSASCGNNIVEGTETCDGACPTSCDDADACTSDVLSGSAASCTAMCQFPAITACVGGDGCCPTGCAFSNDNDCACIPNTCASLGLTCGVLADDGCGGGGEVCGSCLDGRTCVSNLCQLDFDVADPCASNGDCAGVAGVCITQLQSGWDDGYCTRGCVSDSDCGAPNHCGADGFCWKNCSADSDCRSGYLCSDDDGDGLDECAPAGTGSGAVGSPCTQFADCSGGAAGWCATEASQFKGGFCSTDCAVDADCPAGTHCWAAEACVPDCSSALDCRGNGYDCYDGDGDATPECFRFANGLGSVGATCAGMWDCAEGQWGWCMLPGSGYSGGYCTVFCGAGQEVCPNNSACWFDGAASICMDNCQNVNQCRAGYSCTDPGGVGRAVCNP